MEEDNKQNLEEQGANMVANKVKESTTQHIKRASKLAIKTVIHAIGQAIMSLITMLLPYIAIILVLVVLVTGIEYVLELFTAEDTTTSIYSSMGIDKETLGELNVGDIANIVEIKQDNQGYHLEFIDNFDEKLEEAINELTKQNTSINLRHVDSLKKFIIAEAMTKYPNLGGESDGETKFQGTIEIKRLTPDKNPGEVKQVGMKEITLKYVDNATFDGYVNNNSLDALNFYTLDEDKNIVTATWSYSNGTITIQKNSGMNYRDAISAYAMPFEYPLFFLIDGGSEEFSIGLAELAMKSSMEITIVDDVTNSKTTTVYNTIVTQKGDSYKTEIDEDGNTKEVHEIIAENVISNDSSSTESLTESINSKIIITNIDSWAMKKTSTIKMNSSSSNNGDGDVYSDTPESYPFSITLPNGTVNNLTNTTTKTTTIKTEESKNVFEINESEIEESSDGFVKLYKKYEKTLNNNLIPSWLFEMMRNNGKTSNLIEITKLLLYEATGHDYGVTDFKDVDFSDMLDLTNEQAVNKVFSKYTSTITKEEFIELVKNYKTGSSDYIDNLAAYAEKFYDICKDNNINPIYAFTYACINTNYGSDIKNNNLFGIKDEDNNLKEYTSIGDSIKDYCKETKDKSDSSVSESTIISVAEKIFGDKIYTVVSSGGNIQLIHDFIAQWENVDAYKYIYTNELDDKYDEMQSIYDYVSRDKQYFLCGEDIGTGNGTRNYGFGLLHYVGGAWNHVEKYAEE